MGARPELVAVVFCLRCVVEGMRLQSLSGDVEAASRQVDRALETVHRYREARLVSEPPRGLRVARLLWTTAQLVQRERDDLDALRRIFEDIPRGRRELIYACVEHLAWIEFDPWTVAVHPRDRELTGLDDEAYARLRVGNRRDICTRATSLRQFADVRSGSVNERTWQRLGGYAGVRELALRVLAEEPATRGRADLPVRRGRQRAWDYAQVWIQDTVA